MEASTNNSGTVKRFFGTVGIGLLVIVSVYLLWSSSVSDVGRLRGGKRVEIRATSGRVEVLGTQSPDVHVTIENVSAESAKTARIKIDRNRNPVLIKIEDLPNYATAVVEVPQDSNLAISMMAGELQIANVDGDKMCLLRSGKLSIDVGDPEGYKSVRGFVFAGDIHAPALDREKGGLFRMMTWRGHGKTMLDAHVSAGMLELK
jgi:hypothetical protein